MRRENKIDGKDIDMVDSRRGKKRRKYKRDGGPLADHAEECKAKEKKENRGHNNGDEEPPKYNRLSWAEFCESAGSLFLPLLLGHPHIILVGNLYKGVSLG